MGITYDDSCVVFFSPTSLWTTKREYLMLIEVIWEKKKHTLEVTYNNQFGIDVVTLLFFFFLDNFDIKYGTRYL